MGFNNWKTFIFKKNLNISYFCVFCSFVYFRKLPVIVNYRLNVGVGKNRNISKIFSELIAVITGLPPVFAKKKLL